MLSQQRATYQQLRIPEFQHELRHSVGSVLLKRRTMHWCAWHFVTKPSWLELNISGFNLTSCSCSPSSAW